MLTVADVLAAIDSFAPFETAESWDRVGLIVGSGGAEVDVALVAVDVTERVVGEAKRMGAQLIVAHHPVIFSPLYSLCEDDGAGRLLAELVRCRISVIAAHTNWDKARGGVSDALAARLGLGQVEPLVGTDIGRIGRLVTSGALSDCGGAAPGENAGDRFRAVTLAALARMAECALNTSCRVYGDPERQISQVAVCGGSGMEYWENARKSGADVLITGDVRHHGALDALAAGLCVIDAGHWETERPSIAALIAALDNRLQNVSGMIHYPIKLIESQSVAYA